MKQPFGAQQFDPLVIAVNCAAAVLDYSDPPVGIGQRDDRRIHIPRLTDGWMLGAYDGLAPRSTGVVPPTSPFTRATNLIATRDVEKAKALLAEAGVSDLTLQLVALTDSTTQAIAQIIQASLAEAGIAVEIQPTEDAAYWALGDKTAGDGYKSLELALMNFAGGIDPTENLVWFRPDQIGVYNWSFFDSAELATQIDADIFD